MIEQFHFQHPLWLFTLIPLALLLWLSFRSSSKSGSWEKVIDPNLLPFLLQGEDKHTGKLPKVLLAVGWIIASIALADPVWEKVPRPVFQTNTARIIVLDLSNSMLIDDLKPTRLARARFKIEDILSSEFLKSEEGQTGLVVFAGDSFTASPLTRDVDTIRSLLKVLTPQLLPAQGSRVDLGLKAAHELLKQAGVQNGSVLLIADGVTNSDLALTEAKALRNASHRVSVMGVGTQTGGILPGVRNQDGSSINVALDKNPLQLIAQSGGGIYHTISSNNEDLNQLLKTSSDTRDSTQNEGDLVDNILSNDLTNEEWKSMGPFLILILLPLAALAFRKGWLFNIAALALIVGFAGQPQQAMAFSFSDQWDNLWQNKETRAENALQNNQFDKASELAKSPIRKGSANYKKGDYENALKSFTEAEGPDARFNEANALTKLQKYDEAIKAYEQALKEQPDMQDAIDNKKAVEDFLKKKEEQKKQEQSENKDSDKSDQNKDDKKESENSDKSDKSDQNQKKDGDKSEQNKEGEKSEKSKDGKEGKEGEQNKDDSESKDNQFSDANKSLDENENNKEENDNNVDEPQKTESEKTEQEKSAEKEKQNAQQEKDGQKNESEEAQSQAELNKEEAKELSKEEKMAAEQWLRRIPDDPGGLLRRKFQRQYNRRGSANRSEAKPW